MAYPTIPAASDTKRIAEQAAREIWQKEFEELVTRVHMHIVEARNVGLMHVEISEVPLKFQKELLNVIPSDYSVAWPTVASSSLLVPMRISWQHATVEVVDRGT